MQKRRDLGTHNEPRISALGREAGDGPGRLLGARQ